MQKAAEELGDQEGRKEEVAALKQKAEEETKALKQAEEELAGKESRLKKRR